MSVFRVHKTKNFTVMSNYHFKEKEMGLKAKGLLSLMLSLPDSWNYSVSGLVSLSKDGKDGVMSALAELEKFGYLTRKRVQNEKGQFSGVEYHIFEIPQTEKPISEKPISDNPNAENRPQLNTNKLNTNVNKELKELNTKGNDIDIFEDILKDIKDLELRNLYVDFIEMRRNIKKPMTKRSLKMLISRCERITNFNIREQKTMLEASIINHWSNVFLPNEVKAEREEVKQKKIEELKEFYGEW